MKGRILARVDQHRRDLRFPLPRRFVDQLQGRRILALRRRAKYILIELENDLTLLIHLGMSGRMYIQPLVKRARDPHDHVVFTTDEGVVVIFNDARRFGLMDLVPTSQQEEHKLLRDLGPEPLSNNFNAKVLSDRLMGKKTPIKAALLDQRVVAGLGNIYVSEALYRAGISPKRSSYTVAGSRAEKLVPAIRDVLNDAIAAGGSTLRDYVQASGELGYFQHAFQVYDREGQSCPQCSGNCSIRRIVQSGRSTFFCATRQR